MRSPNDDLRLPEPSAWPMPVGLILLVLYAVSHITAHPGQPIPLERLYYWGTIVGTFVLVGYVIETALIRKATQDSLRRTQTPVLRFSFDHYTRDLDTMPSRMLLFLRIQNLGVNVAILRIHVLYFCAGKRFSATGVYNNESNYVLWPGDDIAGPIDVSEALPPEARGPRNLDVLLQVGVYGAKRELLYVHRREWRCPISASSVPRVRNPLVNHYPHTVTLHPEEFIAFDGRVECADVDGLENLP